MSDIFVKSLQHEMFYLYISKPGCDIGFYGETVQNVPTTVYTMCVTFKSDIVLIVKMTSKVKCVKVCKILETKC